MEEHSATEIIVIENGPLQVKSNCRITLSDGTEDTREKVAFFCRCGGSGKKPYCDGTHKKNGFKG